MTAAKRSAADRHVAAKQALPRLERSRDELTAQWRQGLVNDDDSTVERCEHELDVVERKLRRSQALIDLLPPLIQRDREQQQQATWPTSFEAAQAALLALEPEIVRRQAVPKVDRSAAFDAQLDGMISRQYRLTKLIESFAPREMTPQGVKWDGVPLVAR